MQKLLLILSVLGLALNGSAQSGTTASNPPAAARYSFVDTPAETGPAATPATPAVPTTAHVVDDKHRLQPGELDVPYIGLFNVAGKTCKQADDEITALLEKDYYYKATLNIGLVLANKTVGHVYIWGQVKNQGDQPIPSNETITAGKAILKAGGFGEFAKKTRVKVFRTVNGVKKTFELNMEDILEKGHIEKDLPLEPDDLIFVDKRIINM
jgi:protein involved in polysaccharide export with SLBB domain